MTSPPPSSHPEPRPTACPRGSSRPSESARPIPIHGPEFSADPRTTYDRLRAQGPIASVEIAPHVHGRITTTYRAALHLLRNTPGRFAKDPRNWQALREGRVPADSPALMMMQPRDNALWMDGSDHARLRESITGSLDLVDSHALADTVTRIADLLVDGFAADGEADLVRDFAAPLPMRVLISMFGSPPEVGRRIVHAIAKLFDTAQDAAEANAELEAACLELTHLKRRRPGADMTSWLLDHPARLTDAEMIQQILLVVGAGTEPSTDLISNALLLMIDDDQFGGNVHDGVQPVGEALDHVLWEDPPVANYCPLYPRNHETYEGIELEPGVPVLVSFAAANSDPALAAGRHLRGGNRAHLAFSAGVHGCPAPDLARVISETAVERLLDRLPDLTLACRRDQLTRRPGTFHSGWTALPVTFPPVAPSSGETPWTTTGAHPDPHPYPHRDPGARSGSTPTPRTSTVRPHVSVPRGRQPG
ncbi:cytochrome P450 [Streptomyces sp. NPDC047108]|uniref:cytochrome P450 n=1 Tax=Streptomyces sp. NPDC047108 TaxID=3155025 RepID=UPI00340A4E97